MTSQGPTTPERTNRQGQTAEQRAAYEQAEPNLDLVRVAAAEPSHYPLLGELTVRAYEPVLPNLYSGGHAERLADVAGRAGERPILVALFEDFVIGGVTYIADHADEPGTAGVAGLQHLAVDPSAQRLGAGRALVDACIARARADGMQAIWVAASERMAGARALFATVGFVMDPSPADSQSVDDLVGLRLELD